MSAICGIVNLNGEPVAVEYLQRMHAALATHGADGGGMWTNANVGLGQRLMCLTPEDRFEQQPLVSADGQCVLVSDGRVDNRRELTSATPPDGALILRAYETWGVDCVHHLIGAFAFALWDAREQRLLIARSPVGGCSLVYHATPRSLAFATMPKGLFALPFVPRELNLEHVADYLAAAPRERGSSFYRGILRLQPGHWLIARRGEIQTRQFWQLDPKRDLRLPRDDDYVEAFDAIFERVVSDQLRSLTPVGIMMSGGFDSTSVAATAARLLKRADKHLVAFTEVPRAGFAGAVVEGRYADETPFAQAMARTYANLDLNLIRSDGRFYLEDIVPFFEAAETPFRNASNRPWFEAIFHEARRRKVRVLLSGGSGNQTISWDGYGLLPQLLLTWKWRHAWREARALSRHHLARSTLRAVVGQGVMPLLPAPLWSGIERVRRRHDPLLKIKPPWRAYSAIRPEFAAEQRLDERARTKGADFRFRRTRDTRLQRYKTLAGTAEAAADLGTAYQALYGVESRDPTGDQRIVEFCLSLPEEQYLREGNSRWLLRRAMAERLPAEILQNRLRGLQAADWFERLCGARDQIVNELTQLEASELARHVLDLPRMRGLVERMPQAGGDAGEALLDYRAVLDLGLMTGRFLRWFESGA